MKQLFATAFVALALAGCSSMEHKSMAGLTSNKSVEINAAPAAVWNIVKGFDGLNKWHPAFSGDVLKSGANGQVGAVRAITLKDGPTFTEELTAYNDAKMMYSYKIIESPLPLDKYTSTMTVTPKGNGSVLTWVGNYITKAGSGKTDADSQGLIDGAYQAGLDNVKKMAEGK
jgi:Polyketide cyclase / dehydrase and lipid transport